MTLQVVPNASCGGEIPEPPRRADGKIDWNAIPEPVLSDLFAQHSPSEIAEAWSITVPAVCQQKTKRRKPSLADATHLGQVNDGQAHETATADTSGATNSLEIASAAIGDVPQEKSPSSVVPPAMPSAPAPETAIAESGDASRVGEAEADNTTAGSEKPDGGTAAPPPCDLAHLKYVGTGPIPQPPRKPDGRIDWHNVTKEFLEDLAIRFPTTQVAAAWGVSSSAIFKYMYRFDIKTGSGQWTQKAAEQRRAYLAATTPPVVEKPVPWSSKAKFLHMFWEIGAPKIAKMYDCDQTILYDHANALGLPHPKHGFWQKKRRVIPPEVIELMKRLDAEEAANNPVPAAVSPPNQPANLSTGMVPDPNPAAPPPPLDGAELRMEFPKVEASNPNPPMDAPSDDQAAGTPPSPHDDLVNPSSEWL
jgi:hypothetical protein